MLTWHEGKGWGFKAGVLKGDFARGYAVGTPWVGRGYAMGTSWVRRGYAFIPTPWVRFYTHAVGTLLYPRRGYAFVPTPWVRFCTHAVGTLLFAISMHTHKHKY